MASLPVKVRCADLVLTFGPMLTDKGSHYETSGAKGGVSFVIPLPQTKGSLKSIRFNLTPELGFAEFKPFGKEAVYLSSLALLLRVENGSRFVYLALGPVLNRQNGGPTYPPLGHLFIKKGRYPYYFGEMLRAGLTASLTKKNVLDISFSYYLQEGVKRWDMRIGYVFRGGR